MKSLMRFLGEMCLPGNALLIFCGAAAAVAAAMATLRERTGGDPIQDFHILLCTPGKVCYRAVYGISPVVWAREHSLDPAQAPPYKFVTTEIAVVCKSGIKFDVCAPSLFPVPRVRHYGCFINDMTHVRHLLLIAPSHSCRAW